MRAVKAVDRKRVESDPAVDVYALGCVIGELFTEQPPFAEYAEDVIWRLPADTVPFEAELLPAAIRPLLSACCDARAERRPRVQELVCAMWPRVCHRTELWGYSSVPPVSTISAVPPAVSPLSLLPAC